MPINCVTTQLRSGVYVAYGDETESAIGVFDATTDKKVGEDFKLGAHPESFQLEEKGPKIFVNLASISQIAVIDRNTRKSRNGSFRVLETNFPMALDEAHRRMFVAARKPARLLVLDMDTGKEVASSSRRDRHGRHVLRSGP